MSREQLEGNWLNAHVRSLLEERDNSLSLTPATPSTTQITHSNENSKDATEAALQIALKQAKKMVSAAQHALDIYKSLHGTSNGLEKLEIDVGENGGVKGGKRRGVTSRELSGEMGGDTN
jgi:hypothetical protein